MILQQHNTEMETIIYHSLHKGTSTLSNVVNTD